jgi:glycine cleavage system regulatory protein
MHVLYNAHVQMAAVDSESSAQTREHKLRELDEVLAAVDVHVQRLLAEAAAHAEEREKVLTITILLRLDYYYYQHCHCNTKLT